MPIFVSLTLNTIGKVMTLNGLTNGYKPDPSSHHGNPMQVTPVILGPTSSGATPESTNNAIIAAGSNFQGWKNYVSYNLPDGGVLTITIGLKCNTKDPTSLSAYRLTYNSQVSATNYYVSSENTDTSFDYATDLPTYNISIVIDNVSPS